MNAEELKELIAGGETSRVQFKENLGNSDALAAELVAFANTKGGQLIFGVNDKTGEITGLDFAALREIGSRMAQIATDAVRPPISILTETVAVPYGNDMRRVSVVSVREGASKPYMDRFGTMWLKQGSDKRRVLDNTEILRMFQDTARIYADEMLVDNSNLADADAHLIKDYLTRLGEDVADPTEEVCTNLGIVRDGRLTLAGLLFFGKAPQAFRSMFCVKAISFYGNNDAEQEYRDSIDITGTIPAMFKGMMSFLKNNLHHTQQGQSFNSLGRLEISEIALEELCQNALTHRDYSRPAPIRLFVFNDRVEIISPGSLPNGLTVEMVKMGNAVVRNPLITSYCVKAMKYRGAGTGIRRALKEQPNILLENDPDGLLFKVTIPRPPEP